MSLMKKNAFTLIELLIVISVLGLLVALLLPNLMGIRSRARDSARKSDLRQLKVALRTYYNDFQIYPSHNAGGNIVGCGSTGTDACPNSDNSFAVGDVVYMQDMPTNTEFEYLQTNQGDDFLLTTFLENLSDSDLVDSASRCKVAAPQDGAYYVCAD